MALTEISTLGGNYFSFQIERIPNAIYYCQEVNLPTLIMETQDQPTTLGIPIKRPIGSYRFENLVMSFLVDEKMTNWLEIYRWMRHLGNIDTDYDNNQLPFDKWETMGYLNLTKGTYNDFNKVIFHGLFPIALSGLKFTTESNSHINQKATATFAYTYYSFDPDPGNITS
jgi:hypothetical protein